MSDDLWPEELRLDIVSPETLMNIQCQALEARTKGVLRGEISPVPPRVEPSNRCLAFFVHAPAVGARSRLFSIEWLGDVVYPCTIVTSFGVQYPGRLTNAEMMRCSDYDELKEAMAAVLKTKNVGSILSSFIALSNDRE